MIWSFKSSSSWFGRRILVSIKSSKDKLNNSLILIKKTKLLIFKMKTLRIQPGLLTIEIWQSNVYCFIHPNIPSPSQRLNITLNTTILLKSPGKKGKLQLRDEISPSHKLFFKKVLHLTASQVYQQCDLLDLNEKIAEQIWTTYFLCCL